jgi:hypothetical protein
VRWRTRLGRERAFRERIAAQIEDLEEAEVLQLIEQPAQIEQPVRAQIEAAQPAESAEPGGRKKTIAGKVKLRDKLGRAHLSEQAVEAGEAEAARVDPIGELRLPAHACRLPTEEHLSPGHRLYCRHFFGPKTARRLELTFSLSL